MNNDSSIIQECRRLHAQAAELEEIIAMLRHHGLTQADSVKMLREELKMSVSEADHAVIMSGTWEDFRESVLQLRNQFCDALIELGEEEGAQVDIEMDEETGEERVSVTFDLTRPNDEGEKET